MCAYSFIEQDIYIYIYLKTSKWIYYICNKIKAKFHLSPYYLENLLTV